MEEKSNAVLRTEKRLRTAFAQLLCEKSYKDINVKELADYADMSRATFYLHFSSLDEFFRYCKRYLIEVFFRQLIYFLDNRDNLDEVCKRSNLIVSHTDRELFAQYRCQEIYFVGEYDFNTVNPYFYEYFTRKFSDKFVSENTVKIDFFIRAFSVTAMELFDNYSKDRAKREMYYTFLIWDKLFPDYEL